MHIAIINGPNLGNIGSREPKYYGTQSFDDFYKQLEHEFANIDIELSYFQSHCEGALITKLHELRAENVDGVVFNAGAYSHTSIALRDAISSIEIPCVEVHISNVYAREEFRHKSTIAGVCLGSIAGFGLESYRLACDALIKHIEKKN